MIATHSGTLQERIKAACDRIWGENWQFPSIESSYYKGSLIEIEVYFDRLEVTNLEDVRHVARETYVRFALNKDYGYFTGTLWAKRGAATPREVEVGYVHSHPERSYNVWSYGDHTLCIGTGPLKEFYNHATHFSETTFQAFAVALKQFMSYEYNYKSQHALISQIVNGVHTPVARRTFDKDLVIEVLKQNLKEIRSMVKISYSSGKFTVSPTEDLERFLATKTDCPVLKTASGQYYYPSTNSLLDKEKYFKTLLENAPHPVITFRGVPKYARIIDDLQEDVERGEFAHPDFTKKICELLETKITKYVILKNSETVKKSKIYHEF